MRRDLKIAKRYKGLTLTEVVVASALLLIVMVPILKALTSAQMTDTIIERRTRSLILARNKLDDIRAHSLYHYFEPFAEMNVSLDGPYLCDVSDVAINPSIKRITVSVGYDQNDNNILGSDEIQITLATLIARRY